MFWIVTLIGGFVAGVYFSDKVKKFLEDFRKEK